MGVRSFGAEGSAPSIRGAGTSANINLHGVSKARRNRRNGDALGRDETIEARKQLVVDPCHQTGRAPHTVQRHYELAELSRTDDDDRGRLRDEASKVLVDIPIPILVDEDDGAREQRVRSLEPGFQVWIARKEEDAILGFRGQAADDPDQVAHSTRILRESRMAKVSNLRPGLGAVP